MSEVLLRWLNEEVGLSKRVSSVEPSFANGYLFAELFEKYRILSISGPPLSNYRMGTTVEDKVFNFSQLKPVFSNCGIPLSATIANQLIAEKRGCAQQLLLKLRGYLEKLDPLGKRELLAMIYSFMLLKVTLAALSKTVPLRPRRTQFDNADSVAFSSVLC